MELNCPTHFPSIDRLREERYLRLKRERDEYIFDKFTTYEDRITERHRHVALYKDVRQQIFGSDDSGVDYLYFDTKDYDLHHTVWSLLYADLVREGYKVRHSPTALHISWD